MKDDQADEPRVCPLLIEMTENDVTGPLKVLQMVPLNENGMFKLLQVVNRYAIPKPLNEEVLKKAFNKWWPDLKTELDQMEAPQQPGKPSRTVEQMFEEILGIVRSIDKAANRPSPLSRLTIGEPPPPAPYYAPSTGLTAISIGDMQKAIDLQKATEMKDRGSTKS